MDTVSVIITHWNTPEDLRILLSALSKDHSLDIVVIDNNSPSHPTWIKKQFKRVNFVQNVHNLGFAKANNQGTKLARGEWLLFLNPDLQITPSAIRNLVEQAMHNHYDACSPVSIDSYNKPIPTSLSLLIEFSPLNRLIPLSIFKMRTLMGGCLLIKKKVLEKIGGWDERYFLWFEDSDLTHTLLNNQYKIGRVSSVTYTHKGGSSIGKLDYKRQKSVFFRSMNKYADKYFSWIGKIVVRLITKLNI